MKLRGVVVTAAVGAAVVAATAVGIATATSSSKLVTVPPPKAQVTAVAKQFMRALNTKHYARTCRLLSRRFYRENNVPNERHCELGLRVGFTGAPQVKFRIVEVEVDDDYAVVRGLADGVPGKIVLVEENHLFRVLAVSAEKRPAKPRNSGP